MVIKVKKPMFESGIKYVIKECIHTKRYRTKKGLMHWLSSCACIHCWDKLETVKVGAITVEKSRCTKCGLAEILVFVDW